MSSTSASEWFEQIRSKIQSTKADEGEQILLSERSDIWDAKQDYISTVRASKTQHKKKDRNMEFKRRLDNKLAAMDASDDEDSFLVSLMKGRTGDAFNDLILSQPGGSKTKAASKAKEMPQKRKTPSQDQDNDNDEENNKDITGTKQESMNDSQPVNPFFNPDKPRYWANPVHVGTESTYDSFYRDTPYQRQKKEHAQRVREEAKLARLKQQAAAAAAKAKAKENDAASTSLLLLPKQAPSQHTDDAEAAPGHDIASDEQIDQDDDLEESDELSAPLILPAGHQLQILEQSEERVYATKEYITHFREQESGVRQKTRILILVKDSKTANTLLCRVGMKITKHQKDHRGMSNLGVKVFTKGVSTCHSKLPEDDQDEALKRFKTGETPTLIITDELLGRVWNMRDQIGVIINYDVPVNDPLLGLEERLSFLCRTSLHPSLHGSSIKSPKNVCLTMLYPSKLCIRYAQGVRSHFEEKGSLKLVEALDAFTTHAEGVLADLQKFQK